MFINFYCTAITTLSITYVTVMPVSAYMAWHFVWFYPNKLMMMMMS